MPSDKKRRLIKIESEIFKKMTGTKQEQLLSEFGIEKPIFAMPSTLTATPAQVAAASNAGALGVLPAGFMSPDEIDSAVAEIRSLTNKPFAVQIFPEGTCTFDEKQLTLLDRALEGVREGYGIKPVRPLKVRDFEGQFKTLLDLNVPVVGVSLGGLREVFMEEFEAKGIKTFGIASNLRDAKVLRASDVDAVVAQGWDASGLVSYCEVKPEDSEIGTMALIEECSRALTTIPVVAGGSLVSEASVKAAMALGAAGIALTDAMLAAEESAMHGDSIDMLRHTADSATRVSNIVFGRNARTLWNGLTAEIAEAGLPVLPFPAQWYAMEDIYRAALKAGEMEDCPLELGQLGYMLFGEKTEVIIEKFHGWMV